MNVIKELFLFIECQFYAHGLKKEREREKETNQILNFIKTQRLADIFKIKKKKFTLTRNRLVSNSQSFSQQSG